MILSWPQVGGLAALVAVATIVLLRLRPGGRTLFRAALAAAVVLLTASAACLGLRAGLFFELCKEGHVIEWLTALCLTAGWLLLGAALVRRVRQGQAGPLLAVLTAGVFWAAWRELEYGEPFFGRQVWYTRNVFKIQAYLGDEQFYQRLRIGLDLPQSPWELWVWHLVFTAAALAIVLAVAWYVLRRRRQLAADFRQLCRSSGGRFVAAGAAMFVAAQVLGNLARRAIEHAGGRGIWHQMIDEPLEMYGAMLVWLGAGLLVLQAGSGKLESAKR